MKNIAAALVKAQRAFGPALKTSTNPHFRSKYADLSACVEAVIDALNANGIALVQRTEKCDDGVAVATVFVHESGETLECGTLHVPAAKNEPQGYGSALTYARRYSLMAACGIAPEDDDGNAASRAKTAPPTTMARDRVDDFLAAIKDASTVDAVRELTRDGIRAAMEARDKTAHDVLTAAGKARAKELGAPVKEAA